MLSLVLGVALAALSSWLFAALRPRNGRPHRLVTVPVVQATIPFALIAGLVLGLALVVSGIVSLT